MAFVTRSFRETQGEFIWEFEWDGVADFAAHVEDRSFWFTSAQVTSTPAPGGGSTITGVELNARHKEGPHLTDQNPGQSARFRMDPIQILQDFSSSDIDRGSQTTVHTPHQDNYHLSTFRLYGQPKVAIKLVGTHELLQATAETFVPSSSGTGTLPGIPGAPPAITPRPGTCKKFTFVEIPNDDNGYDWLSGALHLGEVDVGSVKQMVDYILNNLGEEECICEIVIIGHGAPGNISVGNGMSGSDRNKEISTTNTGAWLPELLRLRCKFCDESVVYLKGCNVGAGDQGAELLHLISQTLQCAKSVQAPTGVCNAITATGQTQTAVRGAAQPPAPLANPDEPHKSPGSGQKFPLIFSRNRGKILYMDALSILEARYLPRVLGRDFNLALLESAGLRVPGTLVNALRSWLPSAQLVEGANAGFSIDGYLQFSVLENGNPVWQPPWSVLGGGVYVAPLRGKTDILFAVPGRAGKSLPKIHVNNFFKLF
jgi:hypothetical protein